MLQRKNHYTWASLHPCQMSQSMSCHSLTLRSFENQSHRNLFIQVPIIYVFMTTQSSLEQVACFQIALVCLCPLWWHQTRPDAKQTFLPVFCRCPWSSKGLCFPRCLIKLLYLPAHQLPQVKPAKEAMYLQCVDQIRQYKLEQHLKLIKPQLMPSSSIHHS